MEGLTSRQRYWYIFSPFLFILCVPSLIFPFSCPTMTRAINLGRSSSSSRVKFRLGLLSDEGDSAASTSGERGRGNETRLTLLAERRPVRR